MEFKDEHYFPNIVIEGMYIFSLWLAARKDGSIKHNTAQMGGNVPVFTSQLAHPIYATQSSWSHRMLEMKRW